MKTMNQVKTEYIERGNRFLNLAIVKASDEVEADMLMGCKRIIDTPKKKVTLKELRCAVDIIECMAKKGEKK